MAIKIDKDGTQTQVKEEPKTTEEQSKQVKEESKTAEEKLNQAKKNVKILTAKEYNLLPQKEKEKYIPYQPSMSDKAIGMMVRQANARLKILNAMMPAFEQMKVVPSPLPTEKLKELLDSLDKMSSLLEPIEKLAGVPIIGQLVKPLVILINAMFTVIGFAFYAIFAVMRGQSFFMDTVTNTYDQIDWEGIKKAFTESTETTASVEDTQIDWDSIPGKKQYDNIKMFEKDYEKVKSLTVVADVAMKGQKKVSDSTLKPNTWEYYVDKMISIFEKLGVDFSLLNRPSDTEMEQFERLFPNPKLLSKQMSDSINKMVEKQYISIEDNENIKKLKEEADKS